MQNIDDTITIEVKNRLNDLFGETVDESVDFLGGMQPDGSPLKELKSAVLSLDWEITDEVMDDFIAQVNLLKQRFKKDRIVLLFLQLLGSVGNYVQVHGSHSHPEAFKTLNTVFNRLEEVVTTPDMTEAAQKRNLYAEIVGFKQLKAKIATARPPAQRSSQRMPAQTPAREDTLVQKDGAPLGGEEEEVLFAGSGPIEKSLPSKQEPLEVAIAPVGQELPAENREGPPEKRAAFAAVFPDTEPGEEVPVTDEAASPPPDTILDALEEIKQLVRQEFDSLRIQLRLLSRRR